MRRGIKRLSEAVRTYQSELAGNVHARTESLFFSQFFTEPEAIVAAIRSV